MPYFIKCWIEIDIEPKNRELINNLQEAKNELDHYECLQPENRYAIVEVDEKGEEV